MERKIGEIFEYNGEWYQCVNGFECTKCDLHQNKRCTARYNDIGSCSKNSRKDNTPVIFKKLEKVGEPFYRRWTLEGNNKLMQRYKIYTTPLITVDKQKMFYNLTDDLLEIEIKQNKEDMEERELDPHMAKVIDEATQKMGEEIGRQIEANINKQRMKPFNLKAAKAGKPVCTRDGRKARIICFDAKDTQPIIGLYEKDINGITREYLCSYHIDGRMYDDQDSGFDLMMLPEKKEGWVNIYYEHDAPSHREASWVYDKEEEAIKVGKGHGSCYIATVRIEWEE